MSDAPRSCFVPIARERWAEHPRFASQALLLGSHENFRRISRMLADVDGEDSLEARQRLFDRRQWSMRSHEHYEEGKLYPFLRKRFGVKTGQLEAGHERLHAIEIELRATAAERDEPTWARVMQNYDRVLDAHLRDEEELVIPCLLALEPSEFRAYYDGSAAQAVVRAAACSC